MTASSTTLNDLCRTLNLSYHGDPETRVLGVTSLDRLEAHKLVMVESADQILAAQDSRVSVLLHPANLEVSTPGIGHEAPRVAFAAILEYFHPSHRSSAGISDSATVDSRAQVDPSATIGPHCVVGPHAVVGPQAVLSAFVVLEEGSRVGAQSVLGPHVVVGAGAVVGDDCQLEAWSKVGERATLANGVDMGAHTSVGREAKIEAGAKIDNLVLVGPRSVVGPGSILVGQSAIDRDATLHAGVIVAGQGAVGPEAVLHAGVQVGGRSLALGVLDKPGPYLGNPAIPLKEEMRRRAAERKNSGADPN